MRIEVDETHPLRATLGEKLGRHIEAVTRGNASIGAELNEVVAILVIGLRVARPRIDVAYLVNAGAAQIGNGISRLIGAVERTERHALDQAARLASDHGHAPKSSGIFRNCLRERLIDKIVRFVPADLDPARIDVDPLFGIRALHGFGDTVRIVLLHDACGTFSTNVADRAIRIARQLHDHAIDNMRLDRAVVEAHVASGGNPFARVRIVSRLLRRGDRQIGSLLLCRTRRATHQSSGESRSAGSCHEPSATDVQVVLAHGVPPSKLKGFPCPLQRTFPWHPQMPIVRVHYSTMTINNFDYPI